MTRIVTRRRTRHIFRFIKFALLIYFAVTISFVLLLRWIPPLFSALMVENEVASWFGKNKHELHYQWVSIEKMSPALAVAVVAAEDQRFAAHFGFDWQAIKKALAYNQKHSFKNNHKRIRGASTISQQMAKNLFLWSGRSWARKGLEAYFTLLIEMFWSKERILEVYLNIVELGDGVYGVEAAAQKYFYKSAIKLNNNEAALFAAVLPNPHRFLIRAPSGYVRNRQSWILRQMRHLGGKRYLDGL